MKAHGSIFAALALAFVATAGANAQELRPYLTLQSASAVRDGCLVFAREHDLQVTIAIYDQAGLLKAHARMDDASIASAEIAEWKGRSAALYQNSTKGTAEWTSGNHEAAVAPSIATFEGGEALFTVEGAPLGGVGVSGASSQDDSACARAGAAAAGLAVTRPEAE